MIRNLGKEGINIEPRYSEKEAKYVQQRGNGRRVHREATVPFETLFPLIAEEEVEAYFLRNAAGLELKVSNYEDAAPPSGRIGGPQSGILE
ncbi:MAG: hypothetical protein WC595_00835 [Candidatus Nanoarchaeia archaeon]